MSHSVVTLRHWDSEWKHWDVGTERERRNVGKQHSCFILVARETLPLTFRLKGYTVLLVSQRTQKPMSQTEGI